MSRFQPIGVSFTAIAIAINVCGKEPSQTRKDTARFVGAIGCRSSSCHGGTGDKRDQYITWLQKDFHTHASAILLDARSARIAEAVGIAQPQTSSRCTVCHSPFQSVPATQLAATARSDEGVSCESCHGAAEPWLRGHTRKDWTYPMRVTAGMHDLRNPYVRANSCVACHQNIDQELLKGGHPTMVFELDSQSSNEPKHWKDEDPQFGVRSWLVGQAVALRESAWHAHTDSDPSDDSKETSAALAWLLAKATLADPTLPKIYEPSSSDFATLQKDADDLARNASNWNASADSVMAILRALVETDSEFASTKQISNENLFYRARRLVLAIERLSIALNASDKTNKELSALQQDVQRPYDFDTAHFTKDLRAFRSKL